VAELHSGAPWPRHRAKTREQDAGHRPIIVGQLLTSCKRSLPSGCEVSYLRLVNRLIDYLRQNLIIDFQGDLTVAKVRELLAGDDSRDAKSLLAKLVADRSVEEMILVLSDCLAEPVQRSLSDDVMREQLRMYSES
jgi:hypothetical protein